MMDFAYTRDWYEREYHEGLYRLHETTPAEIAEKWAKPRYLSHLRAVWALLPRPLAGEVLEVGIHHGKTACWMLDEFPDIRRVWGVDWSQVAVDFCHMLGRRRLIPFRGDVQRLPFVAGLFDAISCVDFTEHLPPPVYRATVAELSRVSGPGTMMILHHGRPPRPEHINDIPEATLLTDFAAAGWQHIASTQEQYHVLQREPRA